MMVFPTLVNKDKVIMCKLKGLINEHQTFVKDIKLVKDNKKCPKNYNLIDKNLNQGTDGQILHFCLTKVHTSPIDTAFVWEEDKKLYFFISDKY